jgi:tRNA pseudouridine55 synthase
MDGAVLVDKPRGLSSNAALQAVKRMFKAQKAGHAGTLDPLATGLLIVLLGEATKFAGPLLDDDKEYVALLKLGERTSTGDAEGDVLEKKDFSSVKNLEPTLLRFKGEILQTPPMYSALKRDGVPLYRLARKGETVERQARPVTIRELEVLRFAPPRLELRVRCSKGTYIRVLAEDIGEALGTGAHLAGLRRMASGGFSLDGAVTLDALAAMSPVERDAAILPLGALLAGMPRTELDAAAEARLRNGQALQISGLEEGVRAVFSNDGTVIGLARAQAGGLRALRLTQAAEKHR